MLAALTDEQLARPRDVSTLRLIGHGGSPIATETLRRARRRSRRRAGPHLRRHRDVADGDGAAATRSACSTAPLARSCGQPAVGVEVAVADAGRRAVPARRGRRGRGPRPQRDARLLEQAGGDGRGARRRLVPQRATSATSTTTAYVFLVDRAKDMIVTGGENVYSTEVEDVLYRHPAVLEAAVFGVPDERWGEAVHAVVVLRDGVTVDAGRADRPLPRGDRRLQGAQADRPARRAAAEVGRRQGPQARAARAVLLGRCRAAPRRDGARDAVCEHRPRERRPQDVRRRRPDVAGRQGSPPRLDVRHRVGARPPAGLRRPAGPDGAGDVGGAAAALAGPVGPVNLSAPTWVDDPDFDIDNHVRRIALPKPGSMRQLFDLATLLGQRHLRPHAAAVAVHRHRGPARRQGGAGAEDAPHDHRRRGRRADVAAVPRLRPRRPAAAADRRAGRRHHAAAAEPDGGRVDPRPGGRRLPPAARRGPAGQRAADRPDRDPGRQRGDGRDRARRRVSSCPTSRRRTRRCGPSARCGATSRSCGRRSATRRTPPSASAARSTRRS